MMRKNTHESRPCAEKVVVVFGLLFFKREGAERKTRCSCYIMKDLTILMLNSPNAPEKVMKAQRCVTALRTAESGSGGVCAEF